MKFCKVIGIIDTHTGFKQPLLNLGLQLLSEPHCQEWNVSTHPASLSLEEVWKQMFLWREPLRTNGDPVCNFFSSHSNTQTAGECVWCPLCWNMIDDKESLTVPCIAICISIFPYTYDGKCINHCYLDNFPMAWMFKFQNYHTLPF